MRSGAANGKLYVLTLDPTWGSCQPETQPPTRKQNYKNNLVELLQCLAPFRLCFPFKTRNKSISGEVGWDSGEVSYPSGASLAQWVNLKSLFYFLGESTGVNTSWKNKCWNLLMSCIVDFTVLLYQLFIPHGQDSVPWQMLKTIVKMFCMFLAENSVQKDSLQTQSHINESYSK